MGHCYLCGEDNDGGLGLCASCKNDQTQRQSAAPLKPIEALEVGKVHSRRQHNLLLGASLCMTVGLVLLYNVFAGKAPPRTPSGGNPVTVTTPSSQQVSGAILDFIKQQLTCGGSAPSALSIGVTKILPYAPDATGWPVSVMIQYTCADNRTAPLPTYITLYVQANSSETWEVVNPASLTDAAGSTTQGSSLKTRYSNDLKRLQIP